MKSSCRSRNFWQEFFKAILSAKMKSFVGILLCLSLMSGGFSPTSKCIQTFELLAKTDRILWITLDVDGECHYSRLIQLIITDSTVLEVPPIHLAKFRDWEAIKEGIKHLSADLMIKLEASEGRWKAPALSWSIKGPVSNSLLLEQYKKFDERLGNFDGRQWNQAMGKAGIELPDFNGIDMRLIYAFPAGLYINYRIDSAFFFEGSGHLVIFTKQDILASGDNTMYGFLLFKNK